MTRVGVVVLNWNGGAQTVACLESIWAQSYPEKFVILVDNNSAPREREALRQRYGSDPRVQVCLLDTNRGYAGGNNAGIAAALAADADVVCLVTQDVILAPDALALLVRTADADPHIGIVGPKVVDLREPRRVLSIGERVAVALLCVPRTILRYRRPRLPWYAVSGILGCVMLLTRRCLETIGGFDEAFFAYYEEVDFCLRARRHGFGVVCNPQAVARHDGMRGFLAGFTPLSAELKARNLVRLMRRWATPVDWLVLLPTYALLLASSMTLYTVRGRLDIVSALLRGVAAGVRHRAGPLGAAAQAS
jgi:GT2 family glycosyltransferase